MRAGARRWRAGPSRVAGPRAPRTQAPAGRGAPRARAPPRDPAGAICGGSRARRRFRGRTIRAGPGSRPAKLTSSEARPLGDLEQTLPDRRLVLADVVETRSAANDSSLLEMSRAHVQARAGRKDPVADLAVPLQVLATRGARTAGSTGHFAPRAVGSRLARDDRLSMRRRQGRSAGARRLVGRQARARAGGRAVANDLAACRQRFVASFGGILGQHRDSTICSNWACLTRTTLGNKPDPLVR